MSRRILDVATFGLAGLVLGDKKKKTETTAPAPAAPAVMPAADDEKVRMARRRAIVQRMSAKGRASTDLTGDKLGG